MGEQGTVDAVTTPLVSRRTIAKGAAWTAPVVLFAVASPAASASELPPRSAAVTATVTADKEAASQFGTKQINFSLTLTNTGDAAGTVEVLTVTSDATKGTAKGLPAVRVIAVGGTETVDFSYSYVGNAGTATYTITYTVDGVTKTATITA